MSSVRRTLAMLMRLWKLPSVTSFDLELVAALELYVLELAELPIFRAVLLHGLRATERIVSPGTSPTPASGQRTTEVHLCASRIASDQQIAFLAHLAAVTLVP